MSKIALTPNASGTGTFTLASPNSSTSRTLTLPDTTGVLLNDASSLASGKLTGALPAIDGSALTGIASAAFEGTASYTTGTVSVSHGLGRIPEGYQVVLRCTGAGHGYSVGDETDITSQVDGDGGRTTSTTVNATTMYHWRANTNNIGRSSGWGSGGSFIVVFYAW